jgi:hypothetical protein
MTVSQDGHTAVRSALRKHCRSRPKVTLIGQRKWGYVTGPLFLCNSQQGALGIDRAKLYTSWVIPPGPWDALQSFRIREYPSTSTCVGDSAVRNDRTASSRPDGGLHLSYGHWAK